MPTPNPIRALMNFSLQVHQEELQRAGGADSGGRRVDQSEWEPAFKRRESELNNLFAVALGEAERTGFPITDVERRLRDLQTHTLAIMLWPVRARPLSDEERQMVEASGCWRGGPVSDYLHEHTKLMMDAWREVESLALRIELPPSEALPQKPIDIESPTPRPGHEETLRIQGRFLTTMRDNAQHLFDPSGAGIELVGCITNTAHTGWTCVGRPELGIELAVYKAPGPKYIALSWSGPRTGRVLQGEEVTAAEAAAEFIKDGLPVPPGLSLPKEALTTVRVPGTPADENITLPRPDDGQPTIVDSSPTVAGRKPKRSTERGEAREKIIAGLTEHHQYTDGSCLNTEPVGVGDLARKSGVSKSTVSEFFQVEFKGHALYRAVCQDVSKLVTSLRMLRQEFSPHILYGRTPPGEGNQDEE